jgi:hypothetical protein
VRRGITRAREWFQNRHRPPDPDDTQPRLRRPQPKHLDTSERLGNALLHLQEVQGLVEKRRLTDVLVIGRTIDGQFRLWGSKGMSATMLHECISAASMVLGDG